MARKSRKNVPQAEFEIPKTVKFAAWGYARISVENERSEDSIENQTDIIKDYVSDKTDIDLYRVITDLGFSGTDFDRPGYAELMDGIKRGDVQCVIVKDLSRVGRTYIEVGELLFDTFPTYNVRFISINDRYDSFADDAARKKLLILFKNLVNHMYSKDLGVKIKSAHALKQQRGELLGSIPPYGYMFTSDNGGKRLKTEPDSAKIVKLIFDMRAQGDSMIKIADHLNRNSVLAPRNHYHSLGFLTNDKDAKKALWQNGYIGQLLRNEVYIGKQIQGKYERHGKQAGVKPKSEWVIHENAHPAIIDESQFYTVQKLMDEAGKKFKKLGNKLDENILVGKVFCSRCGKSMKRQYYRKNKTEVKYRYCCRDCVAELRYETGLEKVPQFPLEKIVEIITATIQRYMDACITIDMLIEDVANSAAIIQKSRRLSTELQKFQRDRKKSEDMLAAAYTHHLAGLLDSNEFNLARERFGRDKQAAEAGAERVSQELAGYDLEETRRNAFLTNFRKFNGFTELNKTIIGTLIQRIDVSPLSNEIGITLNFMDELEKLNKLVEESEVLTDVL
ncbi:MAG: recombinase family protein [Lachnospiraceae bacterium]|nr:recombinase family protein [Lachnospiraceae bacterium]